MKILVVEDDPKLAALIKRGLAEDGHSIDIEHDGEAGFCAARDETYDVLVLDVMLPQKDGLTILRDLRAGHVPIPILLLTARDQTSDVVAGFSAGADDYLRKPFAFDELRARVRTLGRRAAVSPRLVLRVDSLVFDTETKRVSRADREITLTGKELAYLEYFMRNAGIVITRAMMERALWDQAAELASNVIDVYVGRLRAKVDAEGERPLLVTIRGVGYRFG